MRLAHAHTINSEVQGIYQFSTTNVVTFDAAGLFDNINTIRYSVHIDNGGAVYAQCEFSLFRDLVVTGGFRFDARKVDSLDTNSQLSSKLAFTYAPWEGTNLRGSIGRGFRRPSLAEVYISATFAGNIGVSPNPDLCAEKAGHSKSELHRRFAAMSLLTRRCFSRTSRI